MGIWTVENTKGRNETWKLEPSVRKVVGMVRSFPSSYMKMQVLMQLMCLASFAKNMVKVYHLYKNVGWSQLSN
jgi:hypothetical protein